ncbi:MAG: hypothetical protein Q8900_05780, partial [Bacillota bacterium]|nr:hypothetical protein [Bacillota bacterium]
NVVNRVEYIRVYYVTEEIISKGKKIDAFPKLTEYNDAVFGKAYYIKGNKNTAANLKDDECIIPACISNDYNINVGDKINIKFSNEEVNYTVKGIFSESYNTSSAFETNILINKLPKTVHGQLYIKLYGKDRVTGNEIEEAYREKHDGQLKGVLYTLENRIGNGMIAGQVIAGVFLAIGFVMLFVSCIIIHFMIQNAMITDAKTIAVYKTMGYTSGDILKLYLIFYFTVVSTSCFVGIGGSVFLSNTILISVFKNIGKVVSNNVIIPGIFCYALIVTFVLIIIYKIIEKTQKVKPVYALNGMSNSSAKKKKEYKGNSKMQFSSFGIAFRTLLRNKRGAVSIIITAVVTIFSINFAVISLDVAYTMKDNNDYWLGVDKSDVMITVSDISQFEKVEKIVNEDSNVDYSLNSNLNAHVAMKWKKGMKVTLLYGFVYDDYSKAKLPIIKGRNPEAGNEIAIGSTAASELNKTVGDYIEVYIGAEKRVNMLITGIFQTYMEMGDACRVTKSMYTENDYPVSYDTISIYLKNQKDINHFIKDMKKKIGSSGNVTPRTEAFSSIMNMIAAPQKSAIPPVVALVLLVGSINIFCIVMLKNVNSEKTNGIYKCLGYSTMHLVLSNLYYVGIIAAASMAVAVPMVILFYPDIMKLCLSMFGFLKYPVTYNTWHIVIANLVVLLIFILSTLISSRSLKKVNVRDLVQE